MPLSSNEKNFLQVIEKVTNPDSIQDAATAIHEYNSIMPTTIKASMVTFSLDLGEQEESFSRSAHILFRGLASLKRMTEKGENKVLAPDRYERAAKILKTINAFHRVITSHREDENFLLAEKIVQLVIDIHNINIEMRKENILGRGFKHFTQDVLVGVLQMLGLCKESHCLTIIMEDFRLIAGVKQLMGSEHGLISALLKLKTKQPQLNDGIDPLLANLQYLRQERIFITENECSTRTLTFNDLIQRQFLALCEALKQNNLTSIQPALQKEFSVLEKDITQFSQEFRPPISYS